MATCKGKTKAGGDCGMRPPAGQEFCVNHGGKATEKKAADKGERKDTAGKGSAAAQDKGGDGVGGIVAGVVVGALIAAALVYGGLRLAFAGQAAAAPPLRRVA